MQLVNWETGQIIRQFTKCHDKQITALHCPHHQFGHDSEALANTMMTASEDGLVKIWDRR
jgi:hypothetical protein